MEYPIFQSIVNTIDSSLNKRNINVTTFKTWEESKINATGLEIFIDLSNSTNHLESLSINFDWDRFREASLARQLNGTGNHPVLQSETFAETKVDPVIDIEVTWHFREDRCQPQQTNGDANYRIQKASEWMDHASREVNELLLTDDIITRWHLEIDGDQHGKYLNAINLISYFQYSFQGLSSLSDVQKFVERKLIHILFRAKRVVTIVDDTVHEHAA
ncbi:hypothetical protein DYD21_11160 [Rhodohalobacter sp. SW132]|uniref:hypothetical protein n=1 Tax=Rhodohalobacter sp. SW132 TaxID=2293433 RepID=UPI000E233445|nr:hypothetical protein [Rhodohalobacter sp. SW132]REL33331.1 hypothetical protein DYD21_11160 [Rhodohalobacter sp. SW132]